MLPTDLWRWGAAVSAPDPAGDSSLLPAWGVWEGVGDVFPFTLGRVWGFGPPLGPSLGRHPGSCPSGALPEEVLICGRVQVCAFFRGQRSGTATRPLLGPVGLGIPGVRGRAQEHRSRSLGPPKGFWAGTDLPRCPCARPPRAV